MSIETFPSPIGELYFSIKKERTYKSTVSIVSVPYRGAIFLNCLGGLFSATDVFTVSVPYRGAIFLNSNRAWERKKKTLFPSPIGELYFSMNTINDRRYIK